MNQLQWKAFCSFREELRDQIDTWKKIADSLAVIQKKMASDKGYELVDSIVYNKALDDITQTSDLRYIIVADNPGVTEQTQGQYLIGRAGKAARKFFLEHLGVDMQHQVAVLNKTPIHTPLTGDLKEFLKNRDAGMLYLESLAWMAAQTMLLLMALCSYADDKNLPPELWIVGLSNLKKHGLFQVYRDTVLKCCPPEVLKNVYFFKHFSRSQFTMDIGKEFFNASPDVLIDELHRLGNQYKSRLISE